MAKNKNKNQTFFRTVDSNIRQYISEVGNDIFRLRTEGKTYKQIEALGYSHGNVVRSLRQRYENAPYLRDAVNYQVKNGKISADKAKELFGWDTTNHNYYKITAPDDAQIDLYDDEEHLDFLIYGVD